MQDICKIKSNASEKTNKRFELAFYNTNGEKLWNDNWPHWQVAATLKHSCDLQIPKRKGKKQQKKPSAKVGEEKEQW